MKGLHQQRCRILLFIKLTSLDDCITINTINCFLLCIHFTLNWIIFICYLFLLSIWCEGFDLKAHVAKNNPHWHNLFARPVRTTIQPITFKPRRSSCTHSASIDQHRKWHSTQVTIFQCHEATVPANDCMKGLRLWAGQKMGVCGRI